MEDSLEELLNACSKASRSIRLLTAEASRRATLLRLCCSDYEAALERLETLQELQQQDELGDDQTQNLTTAEASAPGIMSAPSAGAHSYAIPRGISSSPPGVYSFEVSDDSVDRRIECAYADNADFAEHGSALDSSSITESLRQILEQARSIRTSQPSSLNTQSGTKASSAAAVESNRNQTRSPPTMGAGKGTRAQTGGSVRGEGAGATSVKSKTAPGVGDVTRPTAATLARRRSKESPPPSSRRAVPDPGIAISTAALAPRRISYTPGQRLASSSSSTRRRASNLTSNHTCTPHDRRTGATNDTSVDGKIRAEEERVSTVRRRSIGNAAGSSIRPISRFSRNSRGDGFLDGVTPQSREDERGQLPTDLHTAETLALDLPPGMREEISRYSLARERLLGAGGKLSAGGGGSPGAAAPRGLGSTEEEQGGDDETRFLSALDDFSAWGRWGSMEEQDQQYRRHQTLVGDDGRRGRDRVNDLNSSTLLPDPQLAAWDELLLLPRDAGTQSTQGDRRGPVQHDESLAPASGFETSNHNRCKDDGMTTGVERCVEWSEIEKLQRSLLMMLDELEGRRAVSQAREGINWTEDGRNQDWEDDVVATQGQVAAVEEFGDWYSWNKVAETTELLRQYLDVHNVGAPLSKEAALLTADPRSIIGSENPLKGRATASCAEGYSALDWREAWRESDEARGLDGAMCMELVSELQTDESSSCCPLVDCWPHADFRACKSPAPHDDRSKPRLGEQQAAYGATDARKSARNFRNTALLAAEQDVSKMVAPPLARALSRARRLAAPSPKHPHLGYMVSPHVSREDTNRRAPGAGGTGPLESLRERVVSVSPAHQRTVWVKRDIDAEVAWTPALAVYRAVDAVLGGGGRPRICFLRNDS